MVKILLVQPQNNYGRFIPESPSRALLLLGTLAKQRGYDVRIEHIDLIDHDGYGNILTEYKPDILGVTVNTFQVKSARLAIMQAKQKLPDVKIIIGGPHTIAWEDMPAYPVDKKVIGEGENEFLKFIGAEPDIKDINDIPIPDYSMVDLSRFCGIVPMASPPDIAIMASRGCPFNCIFCNTPVFWGKKVRYRDPLLVVGEVEMLHKKWGMNEIFFQDDTFNLNHTWAYEIFEEIIARKLNKDMLFKLACRVNEKMLTEDFLDMAYRAGVWSIFYGCENGDQEMLDRMHKGITLEEIRRAVRITHEAKISSQCSFIVGMPGETWETLTETGDFIREIQPRRYGFSFACPFPGTEFDRQVTESGHKKILDYAEYGYGKIMVRTDELDFDFFEAFRGYPNV